MSDNTESVENKFFSKDSLIIAEVAQAHDGSLGTAHAFIDAVSNGVLMQLSSKRILQ